MGSLRNYYVIWTSQRQTNIAIEFFRPKLPEKNCFGYKSRICPFLGIHPTYRLYDVVFIDKVNLIFFRLLLSSTIIWICFLCWKYHRLEWFRYWSTSKWDFDWRIYFWFYRFRSLYCYEFSWHKTWHIWTEINWK